MKLLGELAVTMNVPCFLWMAASSLLSALCLIVCGVFLILHQPEFDIIDHDFIKKLNAPASKSVVFVGGVLLIIAGVLLLVRFLGYLFSIKRSSCWSDTTTQARQELHWMAFGLPTYSSVPPRISRSVELCIRKDDLENGAILHHHHTIDHWTKKHEKELEPYISAHQMFREHFGIDKKLLKLKKKKRAKAKEKYLRGYKKRYMQKNQRGS